MRPRSSTSLLGALALLLAQCDHPLRSGPQQQEEPRCELGAPEICGQPCAGGVCGCSRCSQEPSYCTPEGVIWGCDTARGCLQPMQTCESADSCVDGGRAGAFCAVGPDSCAALQDAYTTRLDRLYLFPITSAEPGSGPLAYNCKRCSVVAGQCGLGSCWYVTPLPLVDDPEPQHLADLYRRLGCAPESSCDCGPPPDNIECIANPDGGLWQPSDGRATATACVAQ